VFWVAGDDHDFAEANHAWVLNGGGDPSRILLRERPAEAPQLPLWRELCGDTVRTALDELRAGTPETEFKDAVIDWLAAAYRPEASLSDAFASALHALLSDRGLVVFRFHDPKAKRAAAPLLLRALGVTLADGLSPVLVEGKAGRDRLRPDGDAFVTRRGGERFARRDLEQLAAAEPEPLSPNGLLRPAAAAAVDPTLQRTVESARNAALANVQEIEKKLIASLKRTNETLVGQIARARAAVHPRGTPQERVLTYASFAIRYGPELLAGLEA